MSACMLNFNCHSLIFLFPLCYRNWYINLYDENVCIAYIYIYKKKALKNMIYRTFSLYYFFWNTLKEIIYIYFVKEIVAVPNRHAGRWCGVENTYKCYSLCKNEKTEYFAQFPRNLITYVTEHQDAWIRVDELCCIYYNAMSVK